MEIAPLLQSVLRYLLLCALPIAGVCSLLLQGAASLMLAELNTDLQAQQKDIRSHFIAMFCQQNTRVCFFHQVPGLSNLRILDTQAMSGMGFSSWSGTLNSIRQWLVTPSIFVLPLHQKSCRQVTAVGWKVYSWVGAYRFSLVALRVLSSTMNTSQQG